MKTLLAALVFACAAAAPPVAFAEAAPDAKTRIAAARVDYERGRKAIDKMDWKAAIAALESAAAHDPLDPEFQNLLGFSHRNAGNRLFDGHACIHQAQYAAANRRHRR